MARFTGAALRKRTTHDKNAGAPRHTAEAATKLRKREHRDLEPALHQCNKGPPVRCLRQESALDPAAPLRLQSRPRHRPRLNKQTAVGAQGGRQDRRTRQRAGDSHPGAPCEAARAAAMAPAAAAAPGPLWSWQPGCGFDHQGPRARLRSLQRRCHRGGALAAAAHSRQRVRCACSTRRRRRFRSARPVREGHSPQRVGG